MYKLSVTLLLIAAIPPTAFGKLLDRGAFDKPGRGVLELTPHPGSVEEESVAADDKATGHKLSTGVRGVFPESSSLRQKRRTRRPGAAKRERERAPAGRVLPASNSGLPKTASEARQRASKQAARENEMRPTRAESKDRTKHAPGSRATPRVSFLSGESLRVVKGRDGKGQEHYDPTKSRNPLLDTSGANRLKMLSDNFSANEIARSGKKTFVISRIDPQLVSCLQRIRDFVGKPVKIDSGYRSFWHNNDVYRWMGKKPTSSQHISGKASDIKIDGMTGLEIAKVAVDACGPNVAVGVGPVYSHIDVRGDFRAWRYPGATDRQLAELKRYRAASRVAQKGRARRSRRGSLLRRV